MKPPIFTTFASAFTCGSALVVDGKGLLALKTKELLFYYKIMSGLARNSFQSGIFVSVWFPTFIFSSTPW